MWGKKHTMKKKCFAFEAFKPNKLQLIRLNTSSPHLKFEEPLTTSKNKM